jgi:hypothetical protein
MSALDTIRCGTYVNGTASPFTLGTTSTALSRSRRSPTESAPNFGQNLARSLADIALPSLDDRPAIHL